MDENKEFKLLSCKVKNDMETTLHVNDCNFHKPRKWRNDRN